jgi:hypothetical protein
MPFILFPFIFVCFIIVLFYLLQNRAGFRYPVTRNLFITYKVGMITLLLSQASKLLQQLDKSTKATADSRLL